MKRIIAVLVAILMISSLPANIIYAQDTANLSSDSAYTDFVSGLGIVDMSTYDASAVVTRGQFIDMVIKSMNQDPTGAYTQLFTDVLPATPYADSICMAANLGLIAGDGTGVFKPEDPVSYAAAVKITVAALGYTNLARLRGDYPAGYLSVASSLGLTDGISSSSANLTYGECITLIYNLLTADICKVAGIVNGEIDQYRSKGENLLTENFGLTKVEGIIKTAGFESMVPGESIPESTIKVGALALKCNILYAEKYLGYKAQCWYDESKTVKAILLDSENTSVVIDAKDLMSFDDGVLTCDDSVANKDVKYKIDSGYTFVKNGRFYIPSDEDFVYESGKMTLIDNDGDKRYDVVKADCVEYMMAASVDKDDQIVYDSKLGIALHLENTESFHAYITLVDKKGVTAEISAKDIPANSALMVYRSDDGQYAKVVASAMQLSGAVEEFGEDTVVIAGAEYKTNSYFDAHYKLALTINAKFYLAADGTITSLSGGLDGMQYGYLVDCSDNTATSGLEDELYVAILTSGNTVITTELSDKVIYDGVATPKETVCGKLLVDGIPQYQVVRYALSEDAKLTKLDTAAAAPADDSKFDLDYFGNNSLTKHYAGKSSYWWDNSDIFAPYVYYGSTTVAFGVPFSASGATKKYDVDEFACFSPSVIGSYKSGVTIDAFNVDRGRTAGALVVYGDLHKGAISSNTAIVMVESLNDALNSEGEPVKMLTYWQSKKFYRQPLKDGVYDQLVSSGQLPGPGDVARVLTNNNGEVINVYLDIDYNEDLKVPAYGPGIDGSSVRSDYCGGHSYVMGDVLSHSDTKLILKIKGNTINNGSYTLDGNAIPFGMETSVQIVAFETETGKVRHATLDMISDADIVGLENASYVVLKTYDSRTRNIFIYK